MRPASILAPVLMLILGACADEADKRRADWGCKPIGGVRVLTARSAPAYVLIGEFTETNEAPAAFAEIACHMAATGEPLFVGVSEYLGGATDAERAMRARLDALEAKGAPITVGVVTKQGGEYGPHHRTQAETDWARDIVAEVAAANSYRAVILLAKSSASLAPVTGQDERFASYDPMPLHLPEGQVLSLEIVKADRGVVPGGLAAVSLYPYPRNGFVGQLAFASLTRPVLDLELSTYISPAASGIAQPDVGAFNSPLAPQAALDDANNGDEAESDAQAIFLTLPPIEALQLPEMPPEAISSNSDAN
jgi:hypothetical protein